VKKASVKLVNMLDPEVEIETIANGSIIVRSPRSIDSYPDSQSEWLIKWANQTPDRVFIADRASSDGSWRKLSYKEFLDQIQSIGQALLDRNLSGERPVAILSDNGIDNALLLFAAMHVGIPVVPISPAYSLMSKDFGKLRFIIKLVKPGLVFAQDGTKFSHALSSVEFGDAEIVVSTSPPDGIEVTSFDTLASVSPRESVDEAFSKVGPDTVAKILFTSGSTGQPKGVINTQRMLCSNQVAMSQVWTFLKERPPVTVDWLPWNHTFGGNHNLNMMLCNGGTIYVDSGKPATGLIEQTVANLKEISPTIYYNVPRGYDMLLPYLEKDEELRQSFFGDMDILFYAAAALTQNAWERLEQQSESVIGKRVMMLAGWGATETSPDCTQVYWPIQKAGVIGLPIPGTELKLVPNEGKLEIRVRGPNVTPGYWKRDDLTEDAFDEDGFYCIGDAAKFEDKNDPKKGIIFDGRVSENFKLSSGTWVFVGGLRTEVVSASPNIIQDAVITGHDREALGLLIFPNVAGCRMLCRNLKEEVSLAELIQMGNVQDPLKAAIKNYNMDNPASSTRISRALMMEEPPSIDAGEITDKGYLNQRAVLARRADLIDKLYSEDQSVIIFE
jgi:feruloyl-CoA synthase